MASISNNVIELSASKELDHDVPSSERVQENDQPNIPKDSEHSLGSSTEAIQPSTNEPIEFSKSNPDDSLSISLDKKDFPSASNIPKGTSAENVEILSENSTEKHLNSILPKDNETAQSEIRQENGSTKVSQPDASEETGSIKVIQPDTSEKTELLKIESDDPEETRSTKLSLATISGESTEESSLVVSQATNLKGAVQPLDSSDSSSKTDAPILSYDNAKPRVSDDTNPSTELKIPSEKCLGDAIDVPNNEKKLDSYAKATKDMDSIKSLQDCEEYKNGTHFVIVNQSGGGGGYVIATPSPPFTPVFDDFKMPPLSLLATIPSMESLSPSNPVDDAAAPKDNSSNISLSTLVSILIEWVNRGLDKAFNKPHKSSVADFINYAEKELKYEQDILKQMKWRIDTLMRATDCLPDPASMFPRGMRVQNNMIRDDVKEAGMKIWRRLEALEADAKEDYERFVSVCRKTSVYNDKLDKNLEISALNIISNSYVKVSESLSVLKLDIEIFRNKIREFCSELDRFL